MMFLFRKPYLSFSSLVVMVSCLSTTHLQAMEKEDGKQLLFNTKCFFSLKRDMATKEVSPIKIKGPLKNITKIYNAQGDELYALDYDETRGRHWVAHTSNQDYLLPTVVSLPIAQKSRDLELFLHVLRKSPNVEVGAPLLRKILNNDLIEEKVMKITDFKHIKDKIKAVGPKQIADLLVDVNIKRINPNTSKIESIIKFAEKSAHFLETLYEDRKTEIAPYLTELSIGIPLYYKDRLYVVKHNPSMKNCFYGSHKYDLDQIKEAIGVGFVHLSAGFLWELSPYYASQHDFERKSAQLLKNIYKNGKEDDQKEVLEITKPYVVEYPHLHSLNTVGVHISPKVIKGHLSRCLKSIQEILLLDNKIDSLIINLSAEPFNKENFDLFFQFPQIKNLDLFKSGHSSWVIDFPYEQLKGNKNIKRFITHHVGFSEKQIETLAEVLKENKTLTELQLRAGCLYNEDKEIERFAEALKDNTTLQTLALHNLYRKRRNESVKALADALKDNSHLKKLDLTNAVEPGVAQYLMNSLKGNTSLKELYIVNYSSFDSMDSNEIIYTLIKYGKVFNPEMLNLDASAETKLKWYYFLDKVGKAYLPALYLPLRSSFTGYNYLRDALGF